MVKEELVLPPIHHFKRLTLATLIALGIGCGLGLVAYSAPSPTLDFLYIVLKPIELGWMAAIRIVVIPLLISYVIVAIAARDRQKNAPFVVRKATTIHLGLLLAATGFTVALAPPLIQLFHITPEVTATFEVSEDASVSSYPAAIPPQLQEVLDRLFVLPWLSAIHSQILSILVVSFAFAFLLYRMPDRFRIPIVRVFTWIANVSMRGVTWILMAMPLGVLALSYSVTGTKGGDLIAAVGFFIVLVSGLLIVFTLLLYPLVSVFGRIKIGQFARAAAPAQAVAFGTRSSLMCLTALTKGARSTLELPASITSVILPLSVSAFKINRMISTPTKLFFLVYLYSIDLSLISAAAILGFALIKSFGTAGIPSGGSMSTLPLYLAAGIPLEGILILNAVDVIPDIFKTIVNATEDLAVAAITAHAVEKKEAAAILTVATVPEPTTIE